MPRIRFDYMNKVSFRILLFIKIFLMTIKFNVVVIEKTNAQGLNPATKKLFEAINTGDLYKAQISIAEGANTEAINIWGITPLDLAVDKGHFEIVQFLKLFRNTERKKNKKKSNISTNEKISTQSLSSFSSQSLSKIYEIEEFFSFPKGSDPWSAKIVTSQKNDSFSSPTIIDSYEKQMSKPNKKIIDIEIPPKLEKLTDDFSTKNIQVSKQTKMARSKVLGVEKPTESATNQSDYPKRLNKTENNDFLEDILAFFSEKKISSNKPKLKKMEKGNWAIKEIKQAKISPKTPRMYENKKPNGLLDGIILSIGYKTSLNKEPPMQLNAREFYHSCINKKLGSTIFCVENLDWPGDIKGFFSIDSILYKGTKTIVRYDEGAATYYHTLFPSEFYKNIVKYFSKKYGKPTQKINRSIAPLAKKRKSNPTTIWQSIAPVTNILTTLEIRKFDDNRGGFPDTKRGAVYLYHEWSQPIFPLISSVELMLLRAEKKQF